MSSEGLEDCLQPYSIYTPSDPNQPGRRQWASSVVDHSSDVINPIRTHIAQHRCPTFRFTMRGS